MYRTIDLLLSFSGVALLYCSAFIGFCQLRMKLYLLLPCLEFRN